ncbi:MAG: DUF4175 family protein [Sphingobacteriaceae bacterium]
MRGIIFCIAGLLSGYLLIIAGEYWGQFGITLRSLLFYGYLCLDLFLIIGLVFPPLLAYFRLGRMISHHMAAQIIGEHFHEIGDKLLNTLQLKKLADDNPLQFNLIQAGINQKIDTLKPVTFPSAINIRDNLKYVKWAIIPFSVLAVLAIALPSMVLDSTNRLIKHNQYFAPKSPFQFVLLNKNLTAVQGEAFKLNLQLSGNEFPEQIFIETGKNIFKLDKESVSRFHYSFSNMQQSIRFVLKGGDFQSPPFKITVRQKPAIIRFNVALQYPRYLNRKVETIAGSGDLTVPEGTRISWLFYAENTDGINFTMNGERQNIIITGNSFAHEVVASRSAEYTLKPLNKFITPTDSVTYQIQVIKDQLPAIHVEQKVDSANYKALYFSGAIQDDYGFSAINFHYNINRNTPESEINSVIQPIEMNLSQTAGSFFFFWDLNSLMLNAGDEITYFFEVADNDGVNGPKKNRTASKKIRIPTIPEIREQVDIAARAVKQQMQYAILLSGEIDHDAKKINESLLEKNSLSYEEKKRMNDVLEKRQMLEKLIEKLKIENRQNALQKQELKTAGGASLSKQKQIDDLFNNLMDQKTSDSLKKLEEMIQQNEKEMTPEDVSKMQLDSRSVQKELGRIMEVYKQMEFDQKLSETIINIKELSAKQLALSKQNEKGEVGMKTQQNLLNADFKNEQQAINELAEKNEQLGQKNNFETFQEQQKDTGKEMDNSVENLSKGNASKATIAQQSAAQKLKELAEKLKQTSENNQEASNNLNIRQLREIIKSTVNSSFAQEKLMETFKSTQASDPLYKTLTQEQKNIKDNLKTTADSLFALSMRVPQIQSTVNREMNTINNSIAKSLESLEDRITSEANQNQQFVMMSMNNLALLLNNLLQQLQDARSGKSGKKPSSLPELNKTQQQLNQNMQKLREEIQQRGNLGQQIPKQRISGQIATMARQQQMIRQALREINQQRNKDRLKGFENLEHIIKQMEQTETDLVNRQILEETLKRQREIQTGLLEAENAEQQLGEDQKRESVAGKQMPSGYNKAFQHYQEVKKTQVENLRTVSPDFNYFYKSKTKKYFDNLKINSDGRN